MKKSEEIKVEQKLNFHPDCKLQLIEKLANVLSKLDVLKLGWLAQGSYESFSDLEGVPPTSIKTKLIEVIGDSPLSTFFYSRISIKLKNIRDQIKDDCKLSSISALGEVRSLAIDLVDELETLPWNYVLFVQLPLEADCGIEPNYRISSELSFVVPSEELKAQFSFVKPNETAFDTFLDGATGRKRVREWEDKQFYLKGEISGFVDDYVRTTTVDSYLAKIKSFLGLSVAMDLFDHSKSSVYDLQKVAPILVFHNRGQKFEVGDQHLFARAEMDALQSIKLASDIEKKSKEPTKYPGLLGLDSDFTPGRDYYIKDKLKLLSRAFKNNRRCFDVLRAGRWYFEGKCAENQALRFVQLTTSLEILLGDQEATEHMTTLMANRAAYMIGCDHDDRIKIINQFKEIYRVRSKIVHCGNTELLESEYDTWSNLLILCYRVIQRELELLNSVD